MANAQQVVQVFGDRLRAARELRVLSQRELAELLKMPPSAIAHFEGNRRKPSFENLLRLSTALDVTTDYLLGRTDEPVPLLHTDPLVRDLSKLGPDDRDLIGAMLRVLIGRKCTGKGP